MPRISVVMPTYRRPHFLAQALESLRGQTMGDFEAIVGDNAADPATAEVVQRLRDPRIRYDPRPHNLGMLSNVLQAVEDTTSPLVMKLDDDDVLLADALDLLTTPFQEHPDVTLSFGGVIPVDEALGPLPQIQERLDMGSGRAWFPEGLIRPATWLVAQGGVQMAGAVLRRDSVDWDDMPESVATAYDLHLALSAARSDAPFWFTRTPVVNYRLHGASDSHTQASRQAAGAVAALEIAIRSQGHGDIRSLERRLARATVDAGRGSLMAGERLAARTFLRRSHQLRPSPRTTRLLGMTFLPTQIATRLGRTRSRTVSRRPT